MPMEFLHGRPLSPEELEMIRRQIEEGFKVIGAAVCLVAPKRQIEWHSRCSLAAERTTIA